MVCISKIPTSAACTVHHSGAVDCFVQMIARYVLLNTLWNLPLWELHFYRSYQDSSNASGACCALEGVSYRIQLTYHTMAAVNNHQHSIYTSGVLHIHCIYTHTI